MSAISFAKTPSTMYSIANPINLNWPQAHTISETFSLTIFPHLNANWWWNDIIICKPMFTKLFFNWIECKSQQLAIEHVTIIWLAFAMPIDWNVRYQMCKVLNYLAYRSKYIRSLLISIALKLSFSFYLIHQTMHSAKIVPSHWICSAKQS